MSDKQSYKEYREELTEKQGDKTRDEIREQLEKRNEFLLDLDNLKPQEHHWIDRGTVMSCEGGSHPPHRAFKRR